MLGAVIWTCDFYEGAEREAAPLLGLTVSSMAVRGPNAVGSTPNRQYGLGGLGKLSLYHLTTSSGFFVEG